MSMAERENVSALTCSSCEGKKCDETMPAQPQEKFKPLNCSLDHQCVDPETGLPVSHSPQEVDLKFHLCTESPCPVRDQESLDMLQNGFTPHYTPQETGGWEDQLRQTLSSISEGIYPLSNYFDMVRALLREKIAEARKEERFNTIRELDHRYGKQGEKAVEESRAQAFREAEKEVNHIVEGIEKWQDTHRTHHHAFYVSAVKSDLKALLSKLQGK